MISFYRMFFIPLASSVVAEGYLLRCNADLVTTDSQKQDFRCNISFECPQTPTVIPGDGGIYDYDNIHDWIHIFDNNVSPVSRIKGATELFIVNRAFVAKLPVKDSPKNKFHRHPFARDRETCRKWLAELVQKQQEQGMDIAWVDKVKVPTFEFEPLWHQELGLGKLGQDIDVFLHKFENIIKLFDWVPWDRTTFLEEASDLLGEVVERIEKLRKKWDPPAIWKYLNTVKAVRSACEQDMQTLPGFLDSHLGGRRFGPLAVRSKDVLKVLKDFAWLMRRSKSNA